MTYTQLILSDLLNGEKVTVLGAMQKYGDLNARLAIHKIRKMGYSVKCTMQRAASGKLFGEYTLTGKPSDRRRA